VAAIGALVELAGFGLAGVRVFPADTAQEAQAAWDGLPADVGLVILDARAATHLAGRVTDRLTVVMPR
jgi:vacuolar-type H+-ATPase subunit F/Vma7